MIRAQHLFPLAGLIAAVSISVSCAPEVDQTYQPERTSWGAPNIEGLWDFRTLTPLERPLDMADKTELTPEEAEVFRQTSIAERDVDNNRTGDASIGDVEGAYNTFWWDWGTELDDDLRTSLIVDPPNGRLPEITPEALAQNKMQKRLRTAPVRDLLSYSANPEEFRPPGPEALGLSERCLVGFNAGPPFTPSAYNNNLRIIQTPDYIVLVTEMIHDARIIPMDGSPHPPPEMTRWSGDSRGHWDGNTLVVDTTNFSDKTPTYSLPVTFADLAGGVVGSGINLHLTERFTPVGEGRLAYEYTIDDPATFVQPLTVMIPLRATEGPMFEYACHEANYAMPSMLKGARLLEAEAEAETAD